MNQNSQNASSDAPAAQEQAQNAANSTTKQNATNQKSFKETSTNEVQPIKTDEGLTQ